MAIDSTVIFKALSFSVSHLFNRGLGKLPLLGTIYKLVWKTLAPDKLITVQTNGYSLTISTRDWAVTPILYHKHVWEPEETELVRTILRPGAVFVDVGAHVGYYTLLASGLVGQSGAVYAFEPNPHSFALLRKNMADNHAMNVFLYPRAVYERNETVQLLCDRSPASSTIMSTGSRRSVTVEAITLDSVLGDNKVDLIKMDVEGAEVHALRGMRKIIRNNPQLQIIAEVCPGLLRKQGTSLEKYIDAIAEDFDLWIIHKDRLEPYYNIAQFDNIQRRGIASLLCRRKQ